MPSKIWYFAVALSPSRFQPSHPHLASIWIDIRPLGCFASQQHEEMEVAGHIHSWWLWVMLVPFHRSHLVITVLGAELKPHLRISGHVTTGYQKTVDGFACGHVVNKRAFRAPVEVTLATWDFETGRYDFEFEHIQLLWFEKIGSRSSCLLFLWCFCQLALKGICNRYYANATK